jgi:D-tyrosyl-tRNA(Tyr) deacylase
VRALIQRVQHAAVQVDGEEVGRCGPGLLILLGVAPTDTEADAVWLARKLAGLRVFADADGKMNLALTDVGGEALVISQFTLYGDCRKGRRPSFVNSARPELAEPLYERFSELLAGHDVPVQKGIFAADMKVSLLNDGPVTLVVDSP